MGSRLGKMLQAGDVVALFGDLGAGKTTFTSGIADGMGIEADIHSPTFTLIHEHLGEVPLYHVDLYRLTNLAEIEFLGVEEYVQRDGVTVIEWADKMTELLPDERLDITLTRRGEKERELTFETNSPRLSCLIGELQDANTRA